MKKQMKKQRYYLKVEIRTMKFYNTVENHFSRIVEGENSFDCQEKLFKDLCETFKYTKISHYMDVLSITLLD